MGAIFLGIFEELISVLKKKLAFSPKKKKLQSKTKICTNINFINFQKYKQTI